MKINVEVIREDGQVVHRHAASGMTPYNAQLEVAALLRLYAERGTTLVRILNDKSEELYSSTLERKTALLESDWL